MDTKTLILELLMSYTIESYNRENLTHFCANSISRELNISRTLASQYLNELYKEKKLIKIVSRPVIYIPVALLGMGSFVELKKYEFLDFDEFRIYISSVSTGNKIIGESGSLLYPIQQIQSGLLYPNGGLSILIIGESGLGKKYIIQEIINRNIISKNFDKEVQFTQYKFVGKETTDNINDILEYFKIKENEMLIVYFKNTEKLEKSVQLFLLDKLRIYKREINLFNYVITVTRIGYEELHSQYFVSCPIIVTIPSFIERPKIERTSLITHLLYEEAKSINHEIMIDSRIIVNFDELLLRNNIRILKNNIKLVFANSILKRKTNRISNEDFLTIYSNDNQIQFLERSENASSEIINLSELMNESSDSAIMDLIKSLATNFVNCSIPKSIELNMDFLESQYTIIKSNLYNFTDNKIMEESNMTLPLVTEVIDNFQQSLNLYLLQGTTEMISQFLDLSVSSISIRKANFYTKNLDDNSLMIYMDTYISESLRYAKIIISKLKLSFEIHNELLLLYILALNIEFYNVNRKNNKIGAIIISHGVSTATSIAKTANSLLGSNIYSSMDMPLNLSVKDIANKLEDYLMYNNYFEYLIVLVDMGSLLKIVEYMDNAHRLTFGIINNITTSVALEVGSNIMKQKDIFEILNNTVDKVKIEYQVYESSEKKKAIVVTSDLGIEMSKKISRLFKKSIPNEANIEVVDVEYSHLVSTKENNSVFKKYEVIFMVRPEHFNISGINGISLEELLNLTYLNTLNEFFNKYLTGTQLTNFYDNFAINFSLENVISNLTILNVNILMDLVVSSVDNLVTSLDRTISPKIKIGLYMHICFLVERLVTKNEIQVEETVEKTFSKENREFINKALQSFNDLTTKYNVLLPISEIKYLYDYIYSEENNFEKNNIIN